MKFHFSRFCYFLFRLSCPIAISYERFLIEVPFVVQGTSVELALDPGFFVADVVCSRCRRRRPRRRRHRCVVVVSVVFLQLRPVPVDQGPQQLDVVFRQMAGIGLLLDGAKAGHVLGGAARRSRGRGCEGHEAGQEVQRGRDDNLEIRRIQSFLGSIAVHISKQHFLGAKLNTSIVRKSGGSRFETGAAG